MIVDIANMNERQKAILNSAYQVFTEKGYHNAKVSEIAQSAGVGKGTIYEYYESKEALLRGVIKSGMLYYLEKIHKSITGSQDFWQKLNSILNAHANFLNERNAFKKVIGDHFAIINKEFHDWVMEQRNEYLKLIESVVNEGIEHGEISTEYPDWTAKYILASLNSFNDCFNGKSNSQEQVDFILQALKNGISK